MIAGDVVGDLRWHRHRELALRGSRRIDATVDMDVLLRHGKFLHPGNHSLLAFSIGWAIAPDRRSDRSAAQHEDICKTTPLLPLTLLYIGDLTLLDFSPRVQRTNDFLSVLKLFRHSVRPFSSP